MKNVVELASRSTSSNAFSEIYRTYSLTCTQDKGMCVGEIFRQDVRVAYCESLDMDAAQQHLRRIVDWHIKDAIKLRQNAVPDVECWCMASMHVLFDADRQEKDVLNALSINDGAFVPVAELASLAHASNTAEIYYLLSNFARNVCDFIPYEPPYPVDGRDPYLALVCENSLNNDSVRLTSVFSTILKNYKP